MSQELTAIAVFWEHESNVYSKPIRSHFELWENFRPVWICQDRKLTSPLRVVPSLEHPITSLLVAYLGEMDKLGGNSITEIPDPPEPLKLNESQCSKIIEIAIKNNISLTILRFPGNCINDSECEHVRSKGFNIEIVNVNTPDSRKSRMQ